MKFTKKCDSTQHKISKTSMLDRLRNRRSSSAGMFYTSSAGAVTSLILMAALSFLSSAFLNITGLAGANTYADSISMTVSTDNLTINMAPMSSSGEFAKSANMNIAVSTTSSSGYNLSIASSTGNTNLTSGFNSITSISSAISESTFSSSSTYNNKWGYKPSNLYNSSTEQIITNTDFRPLPGTAGEIIAKTKCANGTSPCTNPVDNYTLSIGTRTTNTTPKGDYVSDTFVITAVTNENVIKCDSSKLCVQYDGNGLSFPETSSQLPRTVNNVNYNSTTTSQTITKYAHTPNVSDEGIASGEYSSSMNTTDTVTIDGATSLNVTIYYDAESTSYDWVSVYQSPFDISNTNDATVSTTTGNLSGKLSGRNSGRTTTYSSWYTQSYTVSGDTVKFHFISDSSGQYYGYYAIITGTGTTYDRSVSSGEYATPTGTNSVFLGWSTSQTTPGGGLPSDVEYANESEILAKMPGDEGETKTLYAVWQQSQVITFTLDSNVTKIDVLDASGTTVGTITSSGQSLALAQGDTYTIKPTHTTGYVTNTITKTSGAGTISGKQFTVGAGPATLSVTSKAGGLYNLVADQSKGTQTVADLRAEISTENSGVYEYNASVFGTASDAANTSKIYYYRGILDNTTGSYGSDGDNAAWPNTVLLDTTGNGEDTSDTCWRIVRTTGSGGVKMIYQGKWTGSTCANATSKAQVTGKAFNGTSSDNRQIVRVGYTYNSTYAENTSKSGTIAQIFGSNSNPGANNTRSNIKTYIEDTWYANNMTSYTSKLEASAGYCNDRTMNTSTSWTTPLAESTTIASTYGTSDQQAYYFGARQRTRDTAQSPSLTCGNKYSQIDRSTVDLYRYVAGSSGVSNQLKYPAALLTADEAAFAGSGNSSSTTPYHANSFLYSGSTFWLLSPYNRSSDGTAYGFDLYSYGYSYGDRISYSRGVRPAISLTSGTTAVSGTGTAADPWIVNP